MAFLGLGATRRLRGQPAPRCYGPKAGWAVGVRRVAGLGRKRERRRREPRGEAELERSSSRYVARWAQRASRWFAAKCWPSRESVYGIVFRLMVLSSSLRLSRFSSFLSTSRPDFGSSCLEKTQASIRAIRLSSATGGSRINSRPL